MKIHREIRPLVKATRKAGWTVTMTRSNHLKFTAPDGSCVITSSSPSDTRSVRNLRAQLKRAGYPTS